MQMNKNIAKPLIIQFTPPENQPAMKRSSKSYFVPVNTPWVQFRDNVLPLVGTDDYDSVLVHTRDDVDRDLAGVVGNMSVKLNALSGAGTRAGKPVLTYESVDKPFYIANPSFDDMKAAGTYAPADDTIMSKYNSFESDAAWQEYQSKIWARMKDMMPLSRKADQYNHNHAAQLKDPKRGLTEKELDKFWSFKARQGLAPTVMGDDMIGMPSVEGKDYTGFTMSINQPDGTVQVKPLQVRSLMTVGASGIMIPMANADGNISKHQVAADLTAYGTALHFRAADGKTVAKGELFSKKTREYSFKFTDGTDTHLKATAVASDDTITLQDSHGIFNVKPKSEIINILKDRGYDVPQIITSVKTEQNGKYMWQSPGTMTGSDEVLKTVSPSNPGFIMARVPKNNSDEYVALVAEGALKGHIVAKYVDVKDKNGICFGDRIAGDKGIIVTQVPGVAEAYVKNAITIYDKYNIKGTYIAMDADGRENRNVANGIHTAYNFISKYNPTTVLSWDPAQKGMDDALLAVAQGKITIDEMGIVSGKPEALFPLDKAHVMTPYKLDGTQTKTQAWMQEYAEDKQARIEKVAAAQAATAAREKAPTPAEVHEAAEKGIDIVPPKKASETKDKKVETQRNTDNSKNLTMAAAEGSWVQTPQDISNIQSVTVAKSADMADAMAGTLPIKQEKRPTPTPDADELMAANEEPLEEKHAAEKQDVRSVVDEAVEQIDRDAETFKEIAEWTSANPDMPPLNVPEGYKAHYSYRQPVMMSEEPAVPALPREMTYEPEDGKWGVVYIEVEHQVSEKEMMERQELLNKNGMLSIGNMRLVEQSFTMDSEMSLKLTDDDLQIGDDSGREV